MEHSVKCQDEFLQTLCGNLGNLKNIIQCQLPVYKNRAKMLRLKEAILLGSHSGIVWHAKLSLAAKRWRWWLS